MLTTVLCGCLSCWLANHAWLSCCWSFWECSCCYWENSWFAYFVNVFDRIITICVLKITTDVCVLLLLLLGLLYCYCCCCCCSCYCWWRPHQSWIRTDWALSAWSPPAEIMLKTSVKGSCRPKMSIRVIVSNARYSTSQCSTVWRTGPTHSGPDLIRTRNQ